MRNASLSRGLTHCADNGAAFACNVSGMLIVESLCPNPGGGSTNVGGTGEKYRLQAWRNILNSYATSVAAFRKSSSEIDLVSIAWRILYSDQIAEAPDY